MNKEEQIKFIQDNYPEYTNHISKRRIRHDFFKNIQIGFNAKMSVGFNTKQKYFILKKNIISLITLFHFI